MEFGLVFHFFLSYLAFDLFGRVLPVVAWGPEGGWMWKVAGFAQVNTAARMGDGQSEQKPELPGMAGSQRAGTQGCP